MNIAFAIIEHDQNYSVVYNELLQHIKSHFAHVESGLQGDAWIWVTQEKQKVAVDTFHSMQFEIKSDGKNALLQAVIDSLQKKYPVHIYDTPIER
jgi:hypothetical protein